MEFPDRLKKWLIVPGLPCQLVGYPAVWLTDGLPDYLARPQATFPEHVSVIRNHIITKT